MAPRLHESNKNTAGKKTLCITACDFEDLDRVARRGWRKQKREHKDKYLRNLGGQERKVKNKNIQFSPTQASQVQVTASKQSKQSRQSRQSQQSQQSNAKQSKACKSRKHKDQAQQAQQASKQV